MTDTPVLIAGGGIAGLSMALTLHQIGVRCTVIESVREMKPLGVGINLQPNAVRELFDLGIGEAELDQVGVRTREWALVGLNGNDIYSEPRGLEAGYRWPQYSVHRGRLHLMLYEEVRERLGPDAIRLGERITGYHHRSDGRVDVRIGAVDGSERHETVSILIGADGIHSMVRATMHPGQPAIRWGGAIMWRGTALSRPVRSGASFVGLGTSRKRLVLYPISPPDPATGLAEMNWIAEVTHDDPGTWPQDSWFTPVPVSSFLHHFEGWRWDWLDVPSLISAADAAWENPMIDRDPAPFWNDGPVVLIGDAAHPMYPTGSNGASQAIVDTRNLARALLDHGLNPAALAAYNEEHCEAVSAIVLRNRGAGPFGLLNIIEERCGGAFDDIDNVIPQAEREAFMASYKAAAGFAIEALNKAPRTVPAGAKA